MQNQILWRVSPPVILGLLSICLKRRFFVIKAEAILIKPSNNVVTVVNGAAAGQEIHHYKNSELLSVVTTEEIPPFHKIAVASLKKGAHVTK